MSLNSSILPPHIRQATYASDYSKKACNMVNYNYWTTTTHSINNTPCSNIVSPSSGCYQNFRSFQERFSVIDGQRQCTSYCPTWNIEPAKPPIIPVDPIVEPIIVPEYIPPIESNTSRITFRTQYITIPESPSIIQIAGTSMFNMNAYLGENQKGEYGYTHVTDQQMYTIQNSYLNYNNTVYIDILNNQSTIRSIIFNNGGIREFDNIKSLYNLVELILDNNGISNIDELKYNVNLRTLYLRNNSISSIAPLKNLINLEHLYLGTNNISDSSVLMNFNSLKTIDVTNNKLTNIESLRNKSALTYVNVSHNEISDLSPLTGLTEVAFFGAEGNNVTSIIPLLSMTKLTTVNLANNQIQDINPLLIMLASQSTINGLLNATNNGLAGKINTQGQQAITTLEQLRNWTITF
jgi:hypothetical protein